MRSMRAPFDNPLEDMELESDAALAAARSSRFVFLIGFRFRANRAVVAQQHRIKSYFTPREAIATQIEKLVKGVRRNAEVVVAAHLRLGDYAKYLVGIHFHSLETYREKMCAIERLFHPRKVAFIVLTEAPVDLGVFKGLTVYGGVGSAIADLYTISACDYSFGVPSTFSRWGAYFGEVPHWMMHSKEQEPSLEKFKVPAI